MLAAAISSRASSGNQERDVIAVLEYMGTPDSSRAAPPILKTAPASSNHFRGDGWVKKAKSKRKNCFRADDYPLCLVENNNTVSSLWSVVHSLISTQSQFLAASKIFETITQTTLVLFEKEEGGRFSNSSKTYYSGTMHPHKVAPSTLIPRSWKHLDHSRHESTEEIMPIKLVLAPKELLFIGIELARDKAISMEELLNLINCA